MMGKLTTTTPGEVKGSFRGMTMRREARYVIILCSLFATLASGCRDRTTTVEQPYRLGTERSAVSTTAVGPDGTVYWTWFDREGDSLNVYFSRLEPGDEAPTRPIRVNQRDGEANMHGQAPAQVALGADGEVYVVWTNRIDVEGRMFPASDLLFARSTDRGSTFSNAVVVNDDAGGMPTGHTFHDVAVAPDGTIYVSWIDTRTLDAARTAGSEVMHESDQDEGHMHGHHAMLSDDLPGPEIRVAKSNDGGRSFHPSVVVDRSSCPCCRTSLTVDAMGKVYVAWRKVYDGDIRDMAIAHSGDGGASFSEARRIHVDGWNFNGCPHTGPDVVVDDTGRLHAAWYTGASGGSGLYYAVSDGDQFNEPVTLLSDAPVSQVRMAVDPLGGVWLAWEDPRAEVVRLAHSTNGSVEAPSASFDGNQPALAVGSGVKSMTWTSKNGLFASVIRQ